ncbi:sigma-54 interaction domain-containing protein [Zophobihabitans entericus]|uniref:Sigma 54-interacting transcriptional regulator n=1 Tax=Zophobihabitans entericus TaxID=1635327 RepID=A0A6G9I9Q4_9GAMM|nr:sigma 54-interacting transcriptional regulator [Zophobihabitans entericus]QIQ20567.1 sigma 54-interacting transcriptional regulator [Zophobihabitans entericus]
MEKKALYDSLNLDNETPSTLFVTDDKGNILLSNEFTAMTLGMSLSELLTANVYDLVKSGAYNTSATIQTIETKQPSQVTLLTNQGFQVQSNSTPILRPDGSLHLVLTKSAPLTQKELEQWGGIQKWQQLEQQEQQIEQDHAGIIAESNIMRRLISMCRQIAPYDSRILFYGESGVGKEVLAKFTHDHSSAANGNFIAINCATIPENLFESELFGFKKGAFTSADHNKKGILEETNGGTLFLDEISEMPLSVQTKFLRVLETMEFRPLGSSESIKVNFRLMSASNRDLEQLVAQGKFREDLYYRINVIPVYIPPLRERTKDILILANQFLQRYNQKYTKRVEIDGDISKYLLTYNWPGNIRELKNYIERLVILNGLSGHSDSQNTTKNENDHLDNYYVHKSEHHLEDYLAQVEKHYLEKKLQENNYNISKTAEECRISRPYLYKRLAQLNITVK